MDTPRVNPVGLLETPEGLETAPRRFSGKARILAAALLLAFATATVATTVASLGAYCLTSEGGDVRTLPASFHPHPASRR